MTVTCEMCNKDFSSKGSLRTHRYNFHNSNSAKTNSEVGSNYDLQDHMDFKTGHKRKYDEESVSNSPKRHKVGVSYRIFKREMDNMYNNHFNMKSDIDEIKSDIEDLENMIDKEDIKNIDKEIKEIKINLQDLQFKSQIGSGDIDESKCLKLERRLNETDTEISVLKTLFRNLKDKFEDDEPEPFEMQDIQSDLRYFNEILKSVNFEKVYSKIGGLRDLFRRIQKTKIEFPAEVQHIIGELSDNPKEVVYELLKLNNHHAKKILEQISKRLAETTEELRSSDIDSKDTGLISEVDYSSDNPKYTDGDSNIDHVSEDSKYYQQESTDSESDTEDKSRPESLTGEDETDESE